VIAKVLKRIRAIITWIRRILGIQKYVSLGFYFLKAITYFIVKIMERNLALLLVSNLLYK